MDPREDVKKPISKTDPLLYSSLGALLSPSSFLSLYCVVHFHMTHVYWIFGPRGHLEKKITFFPYAHNSCIIDTFLKKYCGGYAHNNFIRYMIPIYTLCAILITSTSIEQLIVEDFGLCCSFGLMTRKFSLTEVLHFNTQKNLTTFIIFSLKARSGHLLKRHNLWVWVFFSQKLKTFRFHWRISIQIHFISILNGTCLSSPYRLQKIYILWREGHLNYLLNIH